MKHKLSTLFACLLLPLLAIPGAQAQTLIHGTDWTSGTIGSTSPGGAGTTTGAGDGWIDVSGGIATAGSTSGLTVAAGSSPWSTASVVLRPSSETSSVRDQRVVLMFPCPGNANAGPGAVLRWQGGNTNYFVNAYFNDHIHVTIYRNSGGSFSQIGSEQLVTLPTTGDILQMTVDATGASPTTLTVTLTDITTSTVGVNAYTQTDSSGPQVAGQAGITGYNTAVTRQAQVYNLGSSGAATSYSLTPSTASVVTGSAQTYTVTPAGGPYTGTITLSSSGVTGSLSTGSLTFSSSSAAQTFTFTPTSPNTGTATISTSASPSLGTNQSATLTVVASSTIGVTSPAWHFSPGNWAGDSGRGGSMYRRTWNSGAYATVYWTASSSPTATLNITNPSGGSAISYVINGVLVDNVGVPSSGGIAISGIAASAANVLTVFCRNSAQSSRWSDSNAFTVASLTVDASSSAGTAPSWNGKWVLVVGDSITEGIQANNGTDDNLVDYSYLMGQALLMQGYDYCVSACGYSGWIQTGDGYGSGDVPRYYYVSGGVYQGNGSSRWNQIDSTTSLLDSNGHLSAYGPTGQEPNAVFVNYGTNEALTSLSTSDLTASVTQCLAALRTAAPSAWLLVAVPFNLYSTGVYSNGPTYVSALKSGVSGYLSANPSDAKAALVDYGPTVSNYVVSLNNGVHPNVLGHAYIAPQAAASVLAKLAGGATVLKGTPRRPR